MHVRLSSIIQTLLCTISPACMWKISQMTSEVPEYYKPLSLHLVFAAEEFIQFGSTEERHRQNPASSLLLVSHNCNRNYLPVRVCGVCALYLYNKPLRLSATSTIQKQNHNDNPGGSRDQSHLQGHPRKVLELRCECRPFLILPCLFLSRLTIVEIQKDLRRPPRPQSAQRRLPPRHR